MDYENYYEIVMADKENRSEGVIDFVFDETPLEAINLLKEYQQKDENKQHKYYIVEYLYNGIVFEA